jgi:hypothetical protein
MRTGELHAPWGEGASPRMAGGGDNFPKQRPEKQKILSFLRYLHPAKDRTFSCEILEKPHV